MKIKTYIIEVKNEDGQLVPMVVESQVVEFYRKETGHRRVTNSGLSKFVNHLIELFTPRY
jgi:hypothetical protein